MKEFVFRKYDVANGTSAIEFILSRWVEYPALLGRTKSRGLPRGFIPLIELFAPLLLIPKSFLTHFFLSTSLMSLILTISQIHPIA